MTHKRINILGLALFVLILLPSQGWCEKPSESSAPAAAPVLEGELLEAPVKADVCADTLAAYRSAYPSLHALATTTGMGAVPEQAEYTPVVTEDNVHDLVTSLIEGDDKHNNFPFLTDPRAGLVNGVDWRIDLQLKMVGAILNVSLDDLVRPAPQVDENAKSGPRVYTDEEARRTMVEVTQELTRLKGGVRTRVYFAMAKFFSSPSWMPRSISGPTLNALQGKLEGQALEVASAKAFLVNVRATLEGFASQLIEDNKVLSEYAYFLMMLYKTLDAKSRELELIAEELSARNFDELPRAEQIYFSSLAGSYEQARLSVEILRARIETGLLTFREIIGTNNMQALQIRDAATSGQTALIVSVVGQSATARQNRRGQILADLNHVTNDLTVNTARHLEANARQRTQAIKQSLADDQAALRLSLTSLSTAIQHNITFRTGLAQELRPRIEELKQSRVGIMDYLATQQAEFDATERRVGEP